MDVTFMNISESVLRTRLNKHLTNVVLPVTIFIGVEIFFGFFGNILILIVYYRNNTKTNFRYFVMTMATVDFVSCLTTLPGEIFSQLNWYTYTYGWICKVKSFFNILTAWGSASILLILAFDRYRKICHPLRWQIRTTLAFKLCVISLIISSMVAVPVTFLWGKHDYVYNYKDTNITVSVCEKSTQYAQSVYPLVYIGSVYFLPVGLMIFVAGSLNFLTARRVFGKSEEHEPNLSSANTVHSINFIPESLESNSTEGTSVSSSTSSSGNNKKNKGAASNADRTITTITESPKMPRRENIRRHNLKIDHNHKRKIIILLVLTSVFIVTMVIYVVLTSLVAKPDGILEEMSDSEKVAFFFFWRLYFINCVINPILYGFMDPRFRKGLMSYLSFFWRTVTCKQTFDLFNSSN